MYSGLWLEPLRRDLDEFVNMVQSKVNGKVKLRLHNGSCRVVGRSSKNAIYDPDASYLFSQINLRPKACKRIHRIMGKTVCCF